MWPLPHVDVRGVDGGDLVDVAVLERGALVDDVARVDHDVDLELLHDRADHRPRRGVHVEVGDVQDTYDVVPHQHDAAEPPQPRSPRCSGLGRVVVGATWALPRA
jgi:hypothetical protein